MRFRFVGRLFVDRRDRVSPPNIFKKQTNVCKVFFIYILLVIVCCKSFWAWKCVDIIRIRMIIIIIVFVKVQWKFSTVVHYRTQIVRLSLIVTCCNGASFKVTFSSLKKMLIVEGLSCVLSHQPDKCCQSLWKCNYRDPFAIVRAIGRVRAAFRAKWCPSEMCMFMRLLNWQRVYFWDVFTASQP